MWLKSSAMPWVKAEQPPEAAIRMAATGWPAGRLFLFGRVYRRSGRAAEQRIGAGVTDHRRGDSQPPVVPGPGCHHSRTSHGRLRELRANISCDVLFQHVSWPRLPRQSGAAELDRTWRAAQHQAVHPQSTCRNPGRAAGQDSSGNFCRRSGRSRPGAGGAGNTLNGDDHHTGFTAPFRKNSRLHDSLRII